MDRFTVHSVMKTTFLYGLGISLASFALNLLLYFAGFHANAEKLGTAQWIGGLVGFAITVTGLVLVMRARRDETPLDEPFGYGRALGTGTLTVLWSSLISGPLQALYVGVINPGFRDVVMEGEIAKLEAQGLTADQIAGAEKMMQIMTGPVAQAATIIIGGFIFGFLLSLIVAIFVRRPAEETFDEPPPIQP